MSKNSPRRKRENIRNEQRKKKKKKRKFRSKFEQGVFADLKERNIKAGYESYKVSYAVPESMHNYLPDIVLPNNILIECKGYFPLKDRKKMLFIRSYNPHLDIRILFMDARTKLSKYSKTSVGDWADKHKFQWAEKLVPDSWINEKESTNTKGYNKHYDHRIYLHKNYGPYSKWGSWRSECFS